MSIGTSRARTLAISASTFAGLFNSPAPARVSTPSALTASTVSRVFSNVRPWTMTEHPCSASPLAICRPIPRLDPVTRAHLPANFFIVTPNYYSVLNIVSTDVRLYGYRHNHIELPSVVSSSRIRPPFQGPSSLPTRIMPRISIADVLQWRERVINIIDKKRLG